MQVQAGCICFPLLVTVRNKTEFKDPFTLMAKNSTISIREHKQVSSQSSRTENLWSVLSCECKAWSSFIQNKRCISFSRNFYCTASIQRSKLLTSVSVTTLFSLVFYECVISFTVEEISRASQITEQNKLFLLVPGKRKQKFSNTDRTVLRH